MKPPKYTAEQIDEIIARITTLRMRWLSVVETQLALRPRESPFELPGRIPEREKIAAEPAL
jgi:hypothetical protein